LANIVSAFAGSFGFTMVYIGYTIRAAISSGMVHFDVGKSASIAVPLWAMLLADPLPWP
jgi:hypothetical protein